jgi:hypothetical protein
VGFAQKVEIDAASRLSRIVTDFQPAEQAEFVFVAARPFVQSEGRMCFVTSVRRYFYRVLPFSVNKIRIKQTPLETDDDQCLPRSICAHAHWPLWRHTSFMDCG